MFQVKGLSDSTVVIVCDQFASARSTLRNHTSRIRGIPLKETEPDSRHHFTCPNHRFRPLVPNDLASVHQVHQVVERVVVKVS